MKHASRARNAQIIQLAPLSNDNKNHETSASSPVIRIIGGLRALATNSPYSLATNLPYCRGKSIYPANHRCSANACYPNPCLCSHTTCSACDACWHSYRKGLQHKGLDLRRLSGCDFVQHPAVAGHHRSNGRSICVHSHRQI